MKNREEQIIHGEYKKTGERARDILAHLNILSLPEERLTFFERVLSGIWTKREAAETEIKFDIRSAYLLLEANCNGVDTVLAPAIAELDRVRLPLSEAAEKLLYIVERFGGSPASQCYAVHRIITDDRIAPYFSWSAISPGEEPLFSFEDVPLRDRQEIHAAFLTRWNTSLYARMKGILFPLLERESDPSARAKLFFAIVTKAMFVAENNAIAAKKEAEEMVQQMMAGGMRGTSPGIEREH